MHFYSFDACDPVFDVGPWKLSFQVITLENVYGLEPAQCSVRDEGQDWYLRCAQLSWAGQQRHAPGSVTVHGQRTGRHLRLSIEVTAPHKIRAVKILLRDLPPLAVLDLLDHQKPVQPDGVIESYPNVLRLPLLFVNRPDGTRIGLRCEDPQARAKRFAVYQERTGPLRDTYTLECIHEEDARLFDTHLHVPTWVIDDGANVAAFRAEQLAFNEKELGLIPWDRRTDIPAWARDIRLCLTLHGMHWSGYVFNTYDRMLEAIRFAAARIEGKHVLAYLPGWEGRYYWQYGDYRPEPLFGGEDGFARLCEGARALGVHVMPMVGANCANAWAPNFHTFGPSSTLKSPTRNVFLGNQPDWDLSRAHDTGWQAWLNPGAPAWQSELARQVLTLVDRYGFDAVFLDTVEVWTNDPDFNIREGYRALVARLCDGRRDLLVTGEDWWDGLLDIFPIFQQSGHWRQVPGWAGRYIRLIGHIADGDPSRGSTGVFEAGHSAYQPVPDEGLYIPTVALVDGTLERAQPEIEAVIDQARQRR